MAQATVIVRAFEGEPLIRVVIDADDNRVAVANPASLERIKSGDSSPISLPRSDVFEFDPDIFQRLSEEYRLTGGTGPKVWRALKPWAGRVHA